MGVVAVKLALPGGGSVISEDIDVDFGADNSSSVSSSGEESVVQVKKKTDTVRKVRTELKKRQVRKDILGMIMDALPILLIVDEIDNATGESIDGSTLSKKTIITIIITLAPCVVCNRPA